MTGLSVHDMENLNSSPLAVCHYVEVAAKSNKLKPFKT